MRPSDRAETDWSEAPVPACDHCGQVVGKVQEEQQRSHQTQALPDVPGRIRLEAESSLRPDDLARFGEPWYRRWWRKLTGG